MKYLPAGIYSEIYGKTLRNKIMEYFLEASHTDISAIEIIEQSGVSKPKTYQIIEEFIEKNYVVKNRIIGRTQMYKLNKENKIVQIFIRNFNECLRMIPEDLTNSKIPSNAKKNIKVKS